MKNTWVRVLTTLAESGPLTRIELRKATRLSCRHWQRISIKMREANLIWIVGGEIGITNSGFARIKQEPRT